MASSATLSQVLQARENRYYIQQELLASGHPVLSFCMNIPGPVKTSDLILRTFELGLVLLEKKFAESGISVLKHVLLTAVTGPEFICSVSTDAVTLKGITTSIEDSCRAGRLFDMDVIDSCGKKIDRETERDCLVCGKSGRYCASRRIHPVEELQAAVRKIMEETFFEYDRDAVSSLSSMCLLKEVRTTPKPGLVDLNNNGSHKDMDVKTFERSIEALKPYWGKCFTHGFEYKDKDAAECFSNLREIGKEAEKKMLEETGGVNTHRGAVFLLGTLCCAAGRLYQPENPCFDSGLLSSECQALCRDAMKRDFESIKEKKEHSKGETVYLQFGLKGARGELENGFESVLKTALPVYEKALSDGKDENDAACYALLNLISLEKDTNMIIRGGFEKARNASEMTAQILKECPYPSMEKIRNLDSCFIKENLSPGGCADLLAVSIFIHDMKDFYTKNRSQYLH